MYTEVDPGSVKRGGRESKILDAAPENNKNRPKKQKSAQKRGAAADSAPPPPWIRPWYMYCKCWNRLYYIYIYIINCFVNSCLSDIWNTFVEYYCILRLIYNHILYFIEQ